MRWQSADGRVLQGWTGGDPDGPLVAVLHGCPGTRHVAMAGHDAVRAVGVRLMCVNRPATSAPPPIRAPTEPDDDALTARWPPSPDVIRKGQAVAHSV